MRSLPLAALLALGLAAPASAADQTVNVPDFEFAPPAVQINPGEKVTWTFAGPTEHTATSAASERFVRWDSDLKGPGTTFERTFTETGRFNYVCTPHPFMRGTVTVGANDGAPRVTRARAKGAKVTFTLSERSLVTLTVKRRKVTKLLAAGRRSLTARKLKPGRYTGTLVAVDAFDAKSKAARVKLRIR